MSVNAYEPAVFVGNGVTTSFPYTFEIPTDCAEVAIYDPTTFQESIVSPAAYAVSDYDDPSGGTVTYPLSGDPLESPYRLIIRRVVSETQELDIANQDTFHPTSLESALDQLEFQIQQIGRSNLLRVPDGSGLNPAELIAGLLALVDPTAIVQSAFATLTLASGYSPITAPTYIKTYAYSELGDMGGGLYEAVTAEPGHSGKFSITLAGGSTQWYELIDEIVNVRTLGAKGDGVTNDAPAFTAALSVGRSVYVPPTEDDYKFTAAVVLANDGQRIFGDGFKSSIYISSAIDAFQITGADCEVDHLYIHGNRTLGSRAILSSGNRLKAHDLKITEIGNAFTMTSGAHVFADRWHTRNILTTGIELSDGVGFFGSNIVYDTDNVAWYPSYVGTSYAEPTNRFLVLRNEGNEFINCDWIHSNGGVLIEPSGRNIEWCKFDNVFIADSGQGTNAGVTINQTSNTYYIRGIMFSDCWIATNDRGVLVGGGGSAVVDGVQFKGGEIHNNRNEAVRVDQAGAKLTFKDVTFTGNNSAVGTANQIYADDCGEVIIQDCAFQRAFGETTNPYAHIYSDVNVALMEIIDCIFDDNVNNSKIAIFNNNTTVSFSAWHLWHSHTVGGAVASFDLEPSGLKGFTDVKVVLDGIVQAVAGDLNIQFSDDGGTTPMAVAWNRVQHTTAGEGRSTSMSGGRSTTNALQGTIKFDNTKGSMKQVAYESNQDGASGQGLMLLGTIEGTTRIDCVRVAGSAGNISSGSAQVWVR